MSSQIKRKGAKAGCDGVHAKKYSNIAAGVLELVQLWPASFVFGFGKCPGKASRSSFRRIYASVLSCELTVICNVETARVASNNKRMELKVSELRICTRPSRLINRRFPAVLHHPPRP